MGKVLLSKPAMIGGGETSELIMDFDMLTGRDALEVQRRFNKKNPGFVGVVSGEPEYQALLAAKALGCQVEELTALCLRDFNAVTGDVLTFLYETDSATPAKS